MAIPNRAARVGIIPSVLAFCLLGVSGPAGAQVMVQEPGFTVSTFSSGGLLLEPAGLLFAPDGTLLVANSASAVSTAPATGNILAIDSAGNQTLFSPGALFKGPSDLAFSPGGSFGFDGHLFVTLEDADDFGTLPTDAVVRVPPGGGPPVLFSQPFYEANGLVASPSPGFGELLYLTSRSGAGLQPLRIFKVGPSGVPQSFPITGPAGEITGTALLASGPGGAFGSDLYVSTFHDTADPPSAYNLLRVDASGATAVVVPDVGLAGLSFSPDPGGPFCERLFGAYFGGPGLPVPPNGRVIAAVDLQGEAQVFATGFQRASRTAFGPDGSLYVSDPAAHAILKITPHRSIALDIKPRSCPNPLNLNDQGLVTVAILGTADLDVTTIDPTSLLLAGVAPLRWGFEDVAAPFAPFTCKKSRMDCTTAGPDGAVDLVLKLSAQELAQSLSPAEDGEEIPLALNGSLDNGEPIFGRDVIVVRAKGKK